MWTLFPLPTSQTCTHPSPLQLHKEVEKSKFLTYFGTRARLFKVSQFQDPAVKRMLRKLQDIDKAALPEDQLQEVMDGDP